jgi:hypothetical protein
MLKRADASPSSNDWSSAPARLSILGNVQRLPLTQLRPMAAAHGGSGSSVLSGSSCAVMNVA